MRRYIAIIVMVASAFMARAGEVYNIDRNWKFIRSGEPATDNASTVNLPHTWNTDALAGDRNYFCGACTYIKDLDVPSSWNGKRIFLRFMGANSAATVMVNGQLAGQHKGGYSAFTLEVTDMLKPGSKNTIWVIVSNAFTTDKMPTAGDANCYGGLVRGVQLIVDQPIAISPADYSSSGIYVLSHRTNGSSFMMETTVKLTSVLDKTVQVTVTLLDAEGRSVAKSEDHIKLSAKAQGSIMLPVSVDAPRLWDGTVDPYLYKVSVKVWSDGVVYDSTGVHTGFRDYGYSPTTGFMLNGRSYRLNGVTTMPDRAGVGTAINAIQTAQDVDIIREMGANFVYVAGAPYPEQFYDLCDRAGIMVLSGLQFTGEAYLTDRAYYATDDFRRNGKQQLTEMIRQQFNHPSIIMWGLFNCLNTRGDDPTAYVRELQELAKKEDPARYTACASNTDGSLNLISDFVVWRQRFGWGGGFISDMAPWVQYLHRSWDKISSAVSYGAGGSAYCQGDSLGRANITSAWHPERWQTHVHEECYKTVAGDSKLWAVVADNMFDYGAVWRISGNEQGINDMGLVSFDRSTRKDAFYFYKANWNTRDEFVYVAERRWNVRRNAVQTLKIYSNASQVELILNGMSLGTKQGALGTFLWPDITLRTGENTVEARSGDLHDIASITINPVPRGSKVE